MHEYLLMVLVLLSGVELKNLVKETHQTSEYEQLENTMKEMM